MSAAPPRLGSYSVFAALLAWAGLPIYIHAPKVYVDTYGVSLAALGAVLFGLRLLDVVQDPLLGRLSEAFRAHRHRAVTIAAAIMALGMLGLFAIEPIGMRPIWWFALMLTLVFSAFSFLSINFYAQGVLKAHQIGAQGHLKLARWRETGALLGICTAAVAPTGLAWITAEPFTGFALAFALLALIAVLLMHTEWGAVATRPSTGFRAVLKDNLARRLLIIALLNAAPVAVSSTLFLFFVEARLDAPGLEGPLLLLFFLSAALTAPLWGGLAERWGAKPVLIGAMLLAIFSFAFALLLGPGDWVYFALICIASGAALGADLTLLPAIFAARMAQVSPSAAEGFGLWSFASKLSLALAAVTLLPALEAAGFDNSLAAQSPAQSLMLLSLLYAALPCGLKLIALTLLATTPIQEV